MIILGILGVLFISACFGVIACFFIENQLAGVITMVIAACGIVALLAIVNLYI